MFDDDDLEFLLPCLYLHSLKVSQLEKESQEQRERRKMLTAELENANNLHRTFAEKSAGCLGGDAVTERPKPSQNAIKVV